MDGKSAVAFTKRDAGRWVFKVSSTALFAIPAIVAALYFATIIPDDHAKETTTDGIKSALSGLNFTADLSYLRVILDTPTTIQATDANATEVPVLVNSAGRLQVDVVDGNLSVGSVEVDLDHATDTVTVYGSDGTTARALKTSSGGRSAGYDPLLEDAIGDDVVVYRMHGRMTDVGPTAKLFYPGTVGSPAQFWGTASVITVVSDSTDDDTGESGALTIEVVGLNSTYGPATESLTLSGTTEVNGTTSFSRVFRAYITSSGTYHSANVGALTFTSTHGGHFVMPAGHGEASAALYTVPTGRTAYIRSVSTAGGGATDDCTTTCYTMTNVDGSSANVYGLWFQQNHGGGSSYPFKTYIEVPEKSDIWCEGSCATVTPTLTVTVDLVHVAA